MSPRNLISTHVVGANISDQVAGVAMDWNFCYATRGRFAVFAFWSRQTFCAERREQMRQTLLEAHVPFPSSMRSLSRS
jgi:hypothetical protein